MSIARKAYAAIQHREERTKHARSSRCFSKIRWVPINTNMPWVRALVECRARGVWIVTNLPRRLARSGALASRQALRVTLPGKTNKAEECNYDDDIYLSIPPLPSLPITSPPYYKNIGYFNNTRKGMSWKCAPFEETPSQRSRHPNN